MIQKLSAQIPKAFYQHENTERAIVAYNLRVLKHFAPGVFWAWKYWNILGPKNQKRKIVTIYKDFELLI